jgi:hypothetical protein
MNGAPDNAGEIGPQIEQAAKYFSKLGASPKVAVEEAKKRVAGQLRQREQLPRSHWRPRHPTAFPDMAKRYIEDYAKKYGEKEGVSASDLTVQPIGNAAGQWRIVLKKSPGMIVDHPEGIFDLPKLMARREGPRDLEDRLDARSVDKRTADKLNKLSQDRRTQEAGQARPAPAPAFAGRGPLNT